MCGGETEDTKRGKSQVLRANRNGDRGRDDHKRVLDGRGGLEERERG